MSGLSLDPNKVAKTIKLFIGGEFPRTESGRSLPVYVHKTKNIYAHICRASRKDLRNAVTAAQGAADSWSHRSAYNRSQILYRMAEMAESKREEFVETLQQTMGTTKINGNKAVDEMVDAFVYFSGFADKYQQMMGAVNPVSGPHHNFTTTEAVGVVALICDNKMNLGHVAAQIAAAVVSGNTLVCFLPEEGSALLAPLAEVFATSDLPKGVINLLTGDLNELASHFGSHMEIQSISIQRKDVKLRGELQKLAAENMKRVVPPVSDLLSLEHLISYVEFKTVWHPIGH